MAKPTAEKTPANFGAPIDTSTWEKEQVSFDPYFVIKENAVFVATFVGRDDEAKNFVRYQFMAMENMTCQRGPNDAESPRRELVEVKAGETFNISSFVALAKLLDQYLDYSADTGKAIPIQVKCTGSVKTEAGNDCWLWDARVPPAVKAELTAWRREHAPARLKAGAAARAQLEA